MIIHGNHAITKLVIHREHLRLLHAGPLLVAASLNQRFHVVGRRVIRSITRSCVTCRRKSLRPEPPMMGQLPMQRVTLDAVFDRVRVDYAGPILIKRGTRGNLFWSRLTFVFVSLTVKAVHLELVSDLTLEAFIACLRRFITCRGKLSLIWSDHGSIFVGAARQIKELFEFLQRDISTEDISDFCTTQSIVWDFVPERAPHFWWALGSRS